MALRAIAVVYVGLFLYYLQAAIVVQPFWDMYAHVVRYLDFQGGGSWPAYLWEPHVQHRHVWMRLLTAFDIEAFSGAAYPFVISSAACQAGTAWLLWRESRGVVPVQLRTIAGCLVLMLVLTSVSAVVCAIPMFGVYPQVLVFAVFALVLFNGAGGSGSVPPPRAAWRRGGALLAVVAAAFASAVALALWPILAWTAWRSGAGRKWTLAVLLGGAAFSLIYLYGIPITPEGAPEAGDRYGLLRRIDYLLAFMGLPWTRSAALAVPGRVLGGALLVAGVWAVLSRGLLHAPGDRLERLAVALVMFSLSSALLATLGRLDVDPDVLVPVRYSLFLIPLHAGILFLLLPYARGQWMAGRHRAVMLTAVAASVVLLIQQVAAGETGAAAARGIAATVQRFAAGEHEPGMADVVFADLEEAREAADRIEAAGLYRSIGGP